MYDFVVIGGGPGGYVAAIRGAQKGGRVALVEADRVGGTCLNRGCIPTKAMVHSAEVYQAAKEGERFGVEAAQVTLNFEKVLGWKSKTVNQLVSGVEQLLKANGVDTFYGQGQIARAGLVNVTAADGSVKELETKNIIIATGSKVQQFPLSDAAFALSITSDDALQLPEPPGSMVVIGGGILGIEFACIYATFGTKITLVEKLPTILPRVDEEMAKRFLLLLKRRGVTVQTGVGVGDVQELPDRRRAVICQDANGNEIRLEADKVLTAIGRIPNFGGLNLDGLGIAYDRRGIKVDSRLQTNIPGIYAIGDVAGKTFLAYVASAEGIVAADNCTGHPSEMDYNVIPYCVFSMPEMASVGLTEKECNERGLQIKVSKFPYGGNGKALSMGETDGFVKILADAGSGKLVGVHILGAHATDMIHEAAVALKLGATAHDIAETIHAHPTLSEMMMEAAHGIEGDIIHQAPRRR